MTKLVEAVEPKKEKQKWLIVLAMGLVAFSAYSCMYALIKAVVFVWP